MPIRVALVGAGHRAGAFIDAVKRLSGLELVAICDLDRARAEAQLVRAAGDQRAPPAVFTSIDRLLDQQQLDFVAVVTPPPTHHALTVTLAARGVDVFCETPLASTTALADLMIEAVARHGTRLMVAENVFREPMVRAWRHLVDAGVVGDVLRVYALAAQGGHHGVNLLRELSGGRAPLRAVALERNDAIDRNIVATAKLPTHERWLLGVLTDDQGANWVLDYSNYAHLGALGRRAAPRWQVDGRAGTIANDRVITLDGAQVAERRLRRIAASGQITEVRLEGTPPLCCWRKPEHLDCGNAELPLVEALAEMAAWIRGDRIEDAPSYDLEQARLDLATTMALQESAARGGEPLIVPQPQLTGYEQNLHQRIEKRYGVDPFDLGAVNATRFARR